MKMRLTQTLSRVHWRWQFYDRNLWLCKNEEPFQATQRFVRVTVGIFWKKPDKTVINSFHHFCVNYPIKSGPHHLVSCLEESTCELIGHCKSKAVQTTTLTRRRTTTTSTMVRILPRNDPPIYNNYNLLLYYICGLDGIIFFFFQKLIYHHLFRCIAFNRSCLSSSLTQDSNCDPRIKSISPGSKGEGAYNDV